MVKILLRLFDYSFHMISELVTTQMLPPRSGFPKSLHLKSIIDPISSLTFTQSTWRLSADSS